jgi:hypothetical protein
LIVWVWSTLLTLHQEARRRRDIAAAIEELNEFRRRLAGAKTRLRGAAEIDFQIKTLLDKHHVNRYLKVSGTVREEHFYKQTRRGRPGPDMAYRKITKRRFDIEWTIDEDTIAYDHNSDGMYPSCRARHDGYCPSLAGGWTPEPRISILGLDLVLRDVSGRRSTYHRPLHRGRRSAVGELAGNA